MPLRVTQIAIETSIAATDGFLRVTQLAVEASIQATDGFIRVTQLAVETSITPPSGANQLTFFDTNFYDYIPFLQVGVKDHFVFEFVSPSSLVPFIPPDIDQAPIRAFSTPFQEPDNRPILDLRQPRIFISS